MYCNTVVLFCFISIHFYNRWTNNNIINRSLTYNPCEQDDKLNTIVEQLFLEHSQREESSDSESESQDTNETTSKLSSRNKSKAKKKTKHEVDKVRDLDWSRVATLVGNNRTSAECLRRYNKISGHKGGEKAAALKGPWTEEEDKKVISLVLAHGARKWSQIAAELPGKSIMSFSIDNHKCKLAPHVND